MLRNLLIFQVNYDVGDKVDVVVELLITLEIRIGGVGYVKMNSRERSKVCKARGSYCDSI